jgi:3-oxo-5-alpha-steroid 4-dehydrogenase 1
MMTNFDLTNTDDLALAWMALAAVVFIILQFRQAPYGRFHKTERSAIYLFDLNGKLGWFIQEIVSPLSIVYFFSKATGPVTFAQVFCLIVWLIHYINRSIVYTLRTPSMKPTQLMVVLFAVFFNFVNGYLNGTQLRQSADMNMFSLHWNAGFLIFILGMYINIKSDEILMNLRAKSKNKTEYYIPTGFMYNYISCPNYFGELIEWVGFAIMVWNTAALSFVAWTFCNLFPRAMEIHAWYKDKFKEEYPKDRKAFVPFLV